MVIFLAKLNNLEVWGADIGNAYLEAKTKEKLYILPGPELEELEGHILVIYKALYGLKHSGLRQSQKIHDIMLDMVFLPCKAVMINGNVLEEIPKDAPEPLGKSVTTTTFFDANLLHDLITGSLLLLYNTSLT